MRIPISVKNIVILMWCPIAYDHSDNKVKKSGDNIMIPITEPPLIVKNITDKFK